MSKAVDNLAKEIIPNHFTELQKLAGLPDVEGGYFKVDVRNEYGETQVKVVIPRFGDLELARFNLAGIPRNDQGVFFTDVHVHDDFRHRGIGGLMHKLRLRIAKEAEFTSVLCTVNNHNKDELAILESNGWKKIWDVSKVASLYAREL